MITNIKIKSYANINHPVYEKGFWVDSPIYKGDHQNKNLDKFIQNLGIVVIHNNVYSPHILGNMVFIPPKEHFEKASNYYHAILHEAMHRKSTLLAQDTNFKNACGNYELRIGEKPNIISIVSAIEHHGHSYIGNLRNYPAKDVALTYLHQELKCEIVAIDILYKVGLKPDDKDIAHAKNIGRVAETVYSYAGKSIRENAHKPEMLKEYNDLLDSVVKELNLGKNLQKDRER